MCSQQQNHEHEEDNNEAGDGDDDDDHPFTRKPFTRTMQKQERDALQKWVQCAKCAKWRKASLHCQTSAQALHSMLCTKNHTHSIPTTSC